MILRTTLLITGLLFLFQWGVLKAFGISTVSDFAENFLIATISIILYFLIYNKYEKYYKIAYFYLFIVNYHLASKTYLSEFKIEFLIFLFTINIFTIFSITNKKLLIGFLFINFLVIFFTSNLVLKKEAFYGFILLLLISYSGFLYLCYIIIIQRDKILYNENFIINYKSNIEGHIILSKDSEILYVNPIATKIISDNFHSEFIIGSKLLLPLEDYYKYLGINKEIETHDGKYLEIEYSKIYWNQELCNLILIKDTTSQKNKEVLQKKNSIRNLNIIEFINIGILYINSNGSFEYANPCALRLLSANMEDIINKPFTLLFDTKSSHPVQLSIEEKKYFNISREVVHKFNGEDVFIEYTVSPDTINGVIISFNDISSRIQLEKLDNDYKNQLLYLSNTSNRFVEMQNLSDIFQFICDEINFFFPESINLISSYDSRSNLFTTMAHSGMTNKMNEIFGLLGRDLKGISYLDENFIANETKIQTIRSLFDLKYGNFNRKTCIQLEKIFENTHILIIPYSYKNLYLGYTLLFVRGENVTISPGFEVFINQCSLNLFRNLSSRINKIENLRNDPFIQYLSQEYFEMTLDGNILFINHSFESSSGYSLQEIAGKNFGEYLHMI